MTRSGPSPPARRAVTVTSKNGRTSRDALNCLTKFLHIFTPKPILNPLSSFPITILGTQSAFLFVLLCFLYILSLTWSRLPLRPIWRHKAASTLTQPREKGALFAVRPPCSPPPPPPRPSPPPFPASASWLPGGRTATISLSLEMCMGSGSGSQRGKCLCAPLEITSRREMR